MVLRRRYVREMNEFNKKKVHSLLGITHLDGATVNIEEIGPRKTDALPTQAEFGGYVAPLHC